MNKQRFNLTIVCTSVILSVIMILFFIFPERNIKFNDEVNSTKEMITQSTESIEEVEALIALTQNSLGLVEDDNSLLKFKVSNAVVLGDSVAEGLLDYRVLDETVCIGKRGARIDSIDDDFNSIKGRKPSVIFLEYGLNDLGYWRGNADLFIEVYEEKVDMIKKELPDTEIYINCILPIDQSAISNNAVYANYPEFNEKLIELCKKKNLTFIDNSVILNQLEVKYEFDGIHPKYDYYNLWAANMARAAGL